LRVLNIVYVLNQRGQALMPTTQSKSRHLIKGGKAKIIKRIPFTIKLLIASGENKQPVILGIDPGYENVGISARTEKKELIRMDIVLRKDISQKLTEKRMYRRGRRNKLWYREPRWLNRKATKKLGWIAPSVQYRLDSHINRKGFIPSIRRKRYSIQPCDLVKISCNWQSTKGSHCKGTRIIVGKKSININQVKNVFHIGSLIWRTAIPPTAKAVGFLAVNFHDRDNQPMLHL
jgi:N6-L-threonylcarbamoyladenine synthase